MGQIPTLSEQARLVQLLERGFTVKLAANSAGIHYPTVLRWIRQGREDLDRIDAEASQGMPVPGPEAFPALGKFVLELERARAVSTGKILDSVHTAATEGYVLGAGESVREVQPDWKAAAWLLERTAPESFREVVQVDHGAAKSDDETAEEIADRIAAAIAAEEDAAGSESPAS